MWMRQSGLGRGFGWLAAAVLVTAGSGAVSGYDGVSREHTTHAEDFSLDVHTLKADSPYGVLQAHPAQNPHVGAVDADVFVGVGLSDEGGSGDARAIMIYFCDGDDGVWLSGEIIADAPKTFTNAGVTAEVTVGDGVVEGTVTWAGEAQSFTANAVENDAGLYRAWTTHEGVDYVAGWVVLADGRQRGHHTTGSGSGKATIFPLD